METPIFYHTETCPQCKLVERMLNEKHIQVNSCMDVESMKAKGILHTPTLYIGDEALTGKAIFNWIRSH